MDKNTKFANVVKYVKGEIEYEELENILGGKDSNSYSHDREAYNKFVQEIFGCFKDPDFYQYLASQNCLFEAIQKFIDLIQWHLNEWTYEVASKEKAEILKVMITIDDETKLKILNLREEDEYRDYDTVYNPITEGLDSEFIKAFIISLSEEERIKFLVDGNNSLHFRRLNDYEMTEIFNSLSEEDKLRIFSEPYIIEYEGEVVSIRIPILECRGGNSRARGRSAKFGTLLAKMIGDNLEFSSRKEILRNSQSKYDYILEVLGKEIEEIIRGFEVIDDDTVNIINKYFLHRSDEEDLNFLRNNLKRLKGINDDILETAEFELLTKKYQALTSKLDIITCYPEIQQKILELNDNQYRILVETLNIVERDGIKDWIPIFENVINGLNSEQYADLMKSIANKTIEDEATVRKLVYIISSPKNIFEIKGIEEVKEFNRLRYCEKIKNGELQTEYTKGLNELERLKLCVLEKKYGQSLEECKRLLERYGKDLDNFKIQDENDIKVKAYLESIRNILATNDRQTLEKLYNSKETLEENYLFSNIIESEIRGFFVRQYNRELYKIDKDKKIEIDIPSAEGIELYDSGEQFKLVIISLGAYSEYDSNANFEQEWNRKQFASHGFCSSLIANDSISTARIKYLVLGFDSFEENSILLSAPWDIVSTKSNEQLNTSRLQKNILYNIPESQINNTRHTHNEMVWERRELGNGENYKKQPSYIVYIPEIPIERYLQLQEQGKLEDRQARNSIISEYMEKDEIWQNSVRAAKEFATAQEDGSLKPLPIVIVDRTYLAIKEKQKIDTLEQKFERTANPELIGRILVESENNRTGSTFCEGIRETLFSPSILQERIARIEEKIGAIESVDIELAKQCKSMLIQTILEEKEKYSAFGLMPGLKEKPVYDYDTYLNRWIEEYYKPENITEFKKQCLGETGKQDITRIISEIDEMQEYPKEGIHAKRHIHDVVLFSYMIAKKEGVLREDLGLLLEAAKYHDSGRNERFHNGKRADGKDEHAKYSAIVAKRHLQEQGMESDKIAMVQVAILYHEHEEKNINQFDEDEFQRMCLQFGVKEEDFEHTRLMCKYLKDADAIDRTRFKDRGGLKAAYLRTDTAKALIGEAKRINERYRELDSKEQEASLIHIIQEDELEENSNGVSAEERKKATEVLHEMIYHRGEMEVNANG